MGIKLFMLNATDATGFQNSNNTLPVFIYRIVRMVYFCLNG